MEHTQPKFLPAIESTGTCSIAAADMGAGNPFEDEDTPIFSKQKMVLRIPNNYSGDFMHLTVSKNWLVCLLATTERTTLLLRFFLPRAIPPGEILLDKYLSGYNITKIFLDHTGHHLLISLVPKSPGLSADFLYIHGNGPKVRRIEKFKDHEITAVAFNNDMGTETTTAAILLGTSRGLIFETELMQDADKTTYRKQLYDLGLGRAKYPITGLEFHRVPNSNKFIVVATTLDCIYTFQETLKPEDRSMQNVFSAYVNGTREPHMEERKTDLNYSLLRFYAPPKEKYPQQWAWLSGEGIRIGEVSADVNNDAAYLQGDKLLSLDLDKRTHLSYEARRLIVPKAFVLTAFHALLLYPDHITGICLLNQELIYEEYFHAKLGKLLNIIRDAFTGAIYVYTEKTIFNYRITDEARDVWRIYLQQGEYDRAKAYAAEDPAHLDIVLSTRAEAAYNAGDYTTAAQIYADTQKPFEETSIKFMTLVDKRPIITYLRKRLNKLPPSDGSEDSETRIKVLVMWLIELYITQINMPERDAKLRAEWQTEYDEFMRDARVAKCTKENRTDVHQLLSQHADSHNLAQFAVSIGDYEEVINQHLNAERYAEALQTLCKQQNTSLYYKYAPLLMEQLPQQTVNVLIEKGHILDVEKLVPTLIVTDSAQHVAEVIRYLEHAVYNMGVKSEALHNYLLRLYAEHKPTLLIKYLESQGHDETQIPYDIAYALKVCMDFDVKLACVFLQCMLEMWSAAVDLALTFDIQLAKKTASRPRDEDTRRKLWLRIAYHDIRDTDDVKKAMNLLKECDLLRIEDLLPFFSDFEKIDNFKEAICDALKDYNQKIQDLKHDMKDCSMQAARVREDLQNVRLRSVRIEAHETCAICATFLLVKPFFVFVCGHKFHADCLEKQVIPMLSSERSRRLTMLKQQLESLMTQAVAVPQHTQTQQKKRNDIKTQIEEILAADCLYCGLHIETIDQPFVEDWDQVNVDWK